MDGESGPQERPGAWHAIVDRLFSQGTKEGAGGELGTKKMRRDVYVS